MTTSTRTRDSGVGSGERIAAAEDRKKGLFSRAIPIILASPLQDWLESRQRGRVREAG